VTIAFLVAYFRSWWVTGRRLVPIIAFETLLGVGLTATNSGAAVLYVYASSCASQLERPRDAMRAIVAVLVTALLTGYVVDAPPAYWVLAVVITPIIGSVNVHYAQVGRATARLRLAQGEIAHLATVAERERIARDLHDVLGHTLSLITLKSELASKLIARDPERATREIRDVEDASRKALQEVREAIRGYRATLGEELERAGSLLRAASVRATIDGRPDAARPALAPAAEEALALALREAITNVVRHAGASECRVEVRESDRAVHLVVQDDGRRAGAESEGSGLRGMRERIEALGGTVTVTHASGTRLAVTIPTAARPVIAAVDRLTLESGA
jgi:two-component system sensor histidine kinase DesK